MKNLFINDFLLKGRKVKKVLLIMRLSLILTFAVVLNVTANVYSQSVRIDLELKNATLEEVFQSIQEQTGFYFFYKNEQIPHKKVITKTYKNALIDKVLDEVLEGTGLMYRVLNTDIIISKGPSNESYASRNNLFVEQDQPRTVSGKVIDSEGQSLPGVSIVIKGTTQGTITDSDGNYTLTNIPTDAVLVFSFVGMRTQEVVVGNQTSINVTLAEETIGIEEVVAVGYGTQKKANLTGAVTQVKVDKVLRSRPVTNIATALEGSMPGVQITSPSGRPGEQSNIDIRGMMSINGGSPLVLVDNVPMNIHDLNPADIESVSVLKDAAASAIYGGRAAFGVILITTKKALRNEPIKFNYTSNLIFSHPTDLPVKASTLELIEAFQAWGNSYYPTGQDLSIWKEFLSEYENNPSKYPDGKAFIGELVYPLTEYNLYDYTFENSFEQIHNFSFSGGSDKSDFRGSFGYADEDGIMITNKDSYERFNVNLYINTSLTKKLTSTTNVLYLNDKKLTPASYSSLFYLTLRMPSFNYDPSGYYTDDEGSDIIPYTTADNRLKLEPPDQSSNRKLRMLEKIVYSPNKDITVIGEYTYINTNNDNVNSMSGRKYRGVIGGGGIEYFGSPSFYNRTNSNSDYHALNIYADYKKLVNNHNIGFLVGMNQELSKYSAFGTRKNDLMDIENPSLATALGAMTNDESFSDYSISGYFSRLNYSYKNKYLLEANVRYDGSSKFPKGDRFGLFPSISAGWVVTEESFMESLKNPISFLKFRGSWGEIGNQSISNYAYISSMNTFSARWIDLSTNIRAFAIAPPALVSGSFTWETVRTKNLGVDINFFNNKISTTFDYYIRETIDMLGPGAELPKVLGANAPEKNIANLESKGWDCNIEWRENINEFSYSLGLNVSDNRSFVTKFDNKSGVLSQYYNGYEFGEIWGYVTDGYYTVNDFEEGTLNDNLMNGTLKEGIPAFYTVINQNPGDIRFVDLDRNGEISPGSSTLSDPGDRKIIGNSRKRYQFGITGSMTYKNFDFSMFINGVAKSDLWPYINLNNRDDVNFIFWPYSDQYASLYKNQLDYWTPENTDAYYMRNYYGASGNTRYSRNIQTKYLLNGAYIRLKNIELGYTLPKRLSEILFINYTRLFVSVENLLKLDHLPKGMDSEVTTTYNTGGVYPYYRRFNFGLNISF
jgi:TonB-linked SusC/RagA family outer membrane protein